MRKVLLSILLFILLIATLILFGCVSEKPVTQIVIQTQTVTQRVTTTVTSTPPAKTVTVLPTIIQPSLKYEVIDFSYKVVETNTTYWQFSWQATIRNNTSKDLYLVMRAIFIDKDGFLLGSSLGCLVSVVPKGEETIKDATAFILADIAPNVVGMELEIE